MIRFGRWPKNLRDTTATTNTVSQAALAGWEVMRTRCFPGRENLRGEYDSLT